MRKKRLLWNSTSSIISQVFNIISGFILPRLIIQAYGTNVNGLISSISQFLAVIGLSELGMSAVVQASLYKVLANNDEDGISKVMTSATRYFRRIGILLIGYVVGLCALYPVFVQSEFDYKYLATMIVILSINFLAYYFLGITNHQLISADQRVYISNVTNVIVVVINTIVCFLLIKTGAGIHAVKLFSAILFLLRPLVLALYVKKNYKVNRRIKYDSEPIQQKWNGVAQHIAYYVFTSTDAIVLSLFSSLENVSIYSIYVLILNGLKQISLQLENGIKPVLGELRAKNQSEKLRKFFVSYEWFMHTESIVIFGAAASLIVPFVKIYTANITDANYIIPSFAMIITIAYFIQNAGNCYNFMIQAAGHFKQTQRNYIMVACMNLLISVVLVRVIGMEGVAIGTLVSALYQLIWQGWYVYKLFLECSPVRLIRQISIDVVTIAVGLFISSRISVNANDYLHWAMSAIPVTVTWIVIVSVFGILLNRDEIRDVICFFRKDYAD